MSIVDQRLSAEANRVAGFAPAVAIIVRYKGATNSRPSRLIATTANGHRLVQSVARLEDASGNTDIKAAYAMAALLLQFSLGWDKTHRLVMGGIKGGNYVFAQVPKNKRR